MEPRAAAAIALTDSGKPQQTTTSAIIYSNCCLYLGVFGASDSYINGIHFSLTAFPVPMSSSCCHICGTPSLEKGLRKPGFLLGAGRPSLVPQPLHKPQAQQVQRRPVVSVYRAWTWAGSLSLRVAYPRVALRQRTIRQNASAAEVADETMGGGGGAGAGGSTGGGGGGGGAPEGWGYGGEEFKAIIAGLLIGLFTVLNKALILWCAEPSAKARVAGMLDAGLLIVLGPLAGMLVVLSPAWGLPLSLTLSTVALVHLLGECALTAQQPGANWRWDLWTHHITSATLLGFVLAVRLPIFAEHAMRLLVVECTTGLITAFTEARRSKTLKGVRSAVIGAVVLCGFTFRVLWTSSLAWRFMATGTTQAIAAAVGAGPAAVVVAAIIPLWGLNFYWAFRVYTSALKMAGVLPSRSSASAA